jgi:spore maturation protein CgeB
VHTEIFRADEEAAFFGSLEELVAQSKRYLADPDLRKRVANAGRRRVLNRERYQERAAAVVSLIMRESGRR